MLLFYFICVPMLSLLVRGFSILCLPRTLDLESEDPCKFQASRATSPHWELRQTIDPLHSQFLRINNLGKTNCLD